MKKSTHPKANREIYRLCQQINLEDDRGKLRDLVFQLQAALNEEQKRPQARITTYPLQEENPFDTVILG